MKKEAQIIMLPTNKKPKQGDIMFWKGDTSGKRPRYLGINKNHLNTNKNKYLKLQHLYVVTDEEIKEDDWFYNTMSKNIFYNDSGESVPKSDTEFKVIATTDESLKYRSNNGGLGYNLPTFKQSFIEEYCAKGGIDKVMVEYEKLDTYPKALDGSSWGKLILKVNPDNTINIFPVSNEFKLTFEDVNDEFNRFEQKCLDNEKGFEPYEAFVHCFNWIKENLYHERTTCIIRHS